MWFKSIKSVLSAVSKYSPDYAEEPFDIEMVDAKKTFLEKVFPLHEEFGKRDVTKIWAERMSRHLYDLNCMMDTETEILALADH